MKLLLSFFLVIKVCSGQQVDDVTVVKGIPVSAENEVNLSVAEDRIDLDYAETAVEQKNAVDDQIAEESQLTQQIFAEERDGGGHGHHHGHHAEHGPVATVVAAPEGYDSPQAPPAPAPVAEDSYSSPSNEVDSWFPRS